MSDNVSFLPKGTILKSGHNEYCIDDALGYGTFGNTYLATMSGRDGVAILVAVKEFYMKGYDSRLNDGKTVSRGTEAGMSQKYRIKFHQEAEKLSKMNHRNIVKVFDLFDAYNTSYYAMEYIDGGDLNKYIESKTKLEEYEALECACQIGEALRYMHGKNMLHLDLKPSNVVRREDGTLVLIDFGLAKQFDNDGNPSSSTIGSGTVGYAPIEQTDYYGSKGLPVTMDIYALGATLFRMLIGQKVPSASEVLALSNKGLHPAKRLYNYGVSEKTISLVKKAMDPIPKERYLSVGEMIDAMKQIVNSQADDSVLPSKSGFVGKLFLTLLIVGGAAALILYLMIEEGMKPKTWMYLLVGIGIPNIVKEIWD